MDCVDPGKKIFNRVHFFSHTPGRRITPKTQKWLWKLRNNQILPTNTIVIDDSIEI